MLYHIFRDSMNRLIPLLGLLFVLILLPGRAEDGQPVAFISLIKEGAEKDLTTAIGELGVKQRKRIASEGLNDMQFFTEKLGIQRVLVCTFDLQGAKQADEAWKVLQEDSNLKPWWTKINGLLVPHPYVVEQGGLWARCETICKLRLYVSPQLKGEKPSWHAGVTGLKKEKEAEYRLLHTQVWPGVIDAIGNAGISRFDIFLIELNDEVYIFDHFQFVGKNFVSDTARMASNPINKRWWAVVNSCQQPLPSAAARKEIWEPMEPVPDLAR